MNKEAELVQYFCANTQLKTFNRGRTPLTPSGYASALVPSTYMVMALKKFSPQFDQPCAS